jgi:hypothetical protein
MNANQNLIKRASMLNAAHEIVYLQYCTRLTPQQLTLEIESYGITCM